MEDPEGFRGRARYRDTLRNDRNRQDGYGCTQISTFYALFAYVLSQDILARTDDHPESLSTSVKAIRQGLPTVLSVPPIQRILAGQEMALAGLAKQLESLAAHYDQMARACRDIEAGETFSEEDVHGSHLLHSFAPFYA